MNKNGHIVHCCVDKKDPWPKVTREGESILACLDIAFKWVLENRDGWALIVNGKSEVEYQRVPGIRVDKHGEKIMTFRVVHAGELVHLQWTDNE